MKSVLAALIGFVLAFACARVVQAAPPSNEVLCLTTPTQIPRTQSNAITGGIYQNNGANNVWVTFGNNPDAGAPVFPDAGPMVVTSSPAFKIAPGGWLAFDENYLIGAWCISETANQTHGAGLTTIESVSP